MFARIALALALPVAALAQLQVSFIPPTGSPVLATTGSPDAACPAASNCIPVGTYAAAANVTLHFRIQNMDSNNATIVGAININGLYFAIPTPPAIDTTLAPYPDGNLDFFVTFAPPAPPILPQYPALLTIDSFSAEVVAHTVAVPAIADADGASWFAGDTILFPKAQVDVPLTKSFEFTNPWATPVTVSTLSVTGAAFSQPAGVTVPFTLQPGQTQPFQLTFSPTESGDSAGALLVDGQTFVLSGNASQPPLPAASIVISGGGASGQQATLTVQLASAALSPGSGTLTMTFTPSDPGAPDDPTVQFLDTGNRSINVQIASGATSATFPAGPDCTFQTGATAGTINFSLSLGTQSAQKTVTLLPAPVSFDTKTAQIQGSQIAVNLAGLDNTHSASRLSFTFYNISGQQIPGAVIPVDATQAFQQFFSANAAATGGMFELNALFPVTGDASQLGSVAVTATNSNGDSQAITIPIAN